MVAPRLATGAKPIAAALMENMALRTRGTRGANCQPLEAGGAAVVGGMIWREPHTRDSAALDKLFSPDSIAR
jgi:hypothetical protein